MSAERSNSPRHRVERPLAVLVLEPVQKHFGIEAILLHEGQYTIGSGEDCSITANAPSVDPVHARIEVSETGTLLIAKSDRTWLNDRPTLRASLKHGDLVAIGPVTLSLREATVDELVAAELASDRQPAVDHVHQVPIDSTGAISGRQANLLQSYLRSAGLSLAELIDSHRDARTLVEERHNEARKKQLLCELLWDMNSGGVDFYSAMHRRDAMLRREASQIRQRREELDVASTELDRLRRRLTDQRLKLEEEKTRWEHQVLTAEQIAQREQKLSDHERRLVRRQKNLHKHLTGTEQSLEQQRTELFETRLKLIAELDERARELWQKADELKGLETSVERSRERLSHEWQKLRDDHRKLQEHRQSLRDVRPDHNRETHDALEIERHQLSLERANLRAARQELTKFAEQHGLDPLQLAAVDEPDSSERVSDRSTKRRFRLLKKLRRYAPGAARTNSPQRRGRQLSVTPPVTATTRLGRNESERANPRRLSNRTRILVASQVLALGAWLVLTGNSRLFLADFPPSLLQSLGWAALVVAALILFSPASRKRPARGRELENLREAAEPVTDHQNDFRKTVATAAQPSTTVRESQAADPSVDSHPVFPVENNVELDSETPRTGSRPGYPRRRNRDISDEDQSEAGAIDPEVGHDLLAETRQSVESADSSQK